MDIAVVFPHVVGIFSLVSISIAISSFAKATLGMGLTSGQSVAPLPRRASVTTTAQPLIMLVQQHVPALCFFLFSSFLQFGVNFRKSSRAVVKKVLSSLVYLFFCSLAVHLVPLILL